MRGLDTACPVAVRGCPSLTTGISTKLASKRLLGNAPPWPRLQPCTTNDAIGGVAAWRQIGVMGQQPELVRPDAQCPTERPRSRVQWQLSLPLPSSLWPSGADTARTGEPEPSRQYYGRSPADRPGVADDGRRSGPDADKSTRLRSRPCGHACSPSW